MDDIDLLKRLSKTYCEVSGENSDVEVKPKEGQQDNPGIYGEDSHTEKTHDLENKSNIGLIVIDQIDYFLYNTQHSFEKMKCFTTGVGTVLGKLARAFKIPVLVTGEVDGPINYPKYALSPWLNFPADSILLSRVIARDTSETAPKKQLVKPLTVSKCAPFYLSKTEGANKEYKLKFTAKVLSLSSNTNTIGMVAFTTEKTFKNL